MNDAAYNRNENADIPGDVGHTAVTIASAMRNCLENIRLSRSKNTYETYSHALKAFSAMLEVQNVNIETAPVSNMSEALVGKFAEYLKDYSPATERLYLTAVVAFYQYLLAEELASPNMARIRLLISQRARRVGVRLPQFPKDDIDRVIDYISTITDQPVEDEQLYLRRLRDKAFLLTLADTGLRIHEACKLRRGDIDMYEGKAIVIGKGNREAVVRFSARALAAIRAYLNLRGKHDGATGRQLLALPVFARHDRGAGKRVQAITTVAGRNIVNQRVVEALGQQALGSITPHSFRHYFVTRVLQASGNLKMAQELARHQNIAVTQRYAHLSDHDLDQGYFDAIEKE